MNEERHEYELTVITGGEENVDIQNLLTERSALEVIMKQAEKIRLAYPIKKNDFAFMTVAGFGMMPQEIALLRRELDANQHILRYLILRFTSKIDDKESVPLSSPIVREETISKNKTSDLLTNEALEKKIEEISK